MGTNREFRSPRHAMSRRRSRSSFSMLVARQPCREPVLTNANCVRPTISGRKTPSINTCRSTAQRPSGQASARRLLESVSVVVENQTTSHSEPISIIPEIGDHLIVAVIAINEDQRCHSLSKHRWNAVGTPLDLQELVTFAAGRAGDA